MIDSEVIIIGGGPAGSTCAWQLRQAGIETIILDRQSFPRTKLCAGWITPRVIRDLEIELASYPHSLLTFDRLHFRIHQRKLAIRTRQYSIRRYEFDHWLLERAKVPVYQHTARHIRTEKGSYLIDEAYRCKYLVGAAGTNCPVYRTFFQQVNPRPRALLITTMEQEFACAYQDPNCYLWFAEHNLPGYSWYVPKGNGHLNLGIGGKFAELKARGETIRDHWERFVQSLSRLGLIGDVALQPRGYNYYLRQKMQTGRVGNAFLVGDAAGLATTDMGEGIGPAVESGLLAARAIIHRTDYSLQAITRRSLWNILLPWRW